MKKFLSTHGRTLALAGVLLPLLALFVYVGLRAGPLAPIPVTVATVENQSIAPALFGIGTVEARYTYKIGPTVAGRVKSVAVQVGDRVRTGQVLGEMDPIDLDDRIGALEAASMRAQANVLVASAQIQDVSARKRYAETQAQRYEKLLEARAVSEEAVEAKRQERQIAEAGLQAARANLNAAKQELLRSRAERDGLLRQRANMRLIAPVAGLVSVRAADPGTTVVAGQAVVEVIDPASVWINVRFDQLRTAGLREGLAAGIVPRSFVAHSQAEQSLAGRVARVEPMADAVTEESLAKVVFDTLPNPLPPIGELAEVTVALSALPARPVVGNASVRQLNGQLGVFVVEEDSLRFAPVKLGAADLAGRVQILDGLKGGERVVVYSQRALAADSRFKVVDSLPGVAR
ncbi:MAG: efflux RND transporter periplasmic adaptor subunit [Pseudomonadota bacterium]|nr:efflux RND transporter periplasmic adaptor subunit [Pseudomonadota bacterium]MDP1572707.1 efflux RND transporter periplasmic adaptor subunit [Pseudomonadota bacterium]MDP1906579.1 efflux RND transporter periplasmic adaptor subunit [Pseudomonadota bacterium]